MAEAQDKSDLNTHLVYPNQIKMHEEVMTLRIPRKDSTEFKNMVASIKQPRIDEQGNTVSDHGLLNAIVVRPMPGVAGSYAIVDGLHRLTAWTEAFGYAKPIPARILNLSDDQALEAQIEANALKVDTKNAQYARQIASILARHPERSLEEQAQRLSMEPNWLRSILKLVSLPQAIQNKVDNGSIPLSVGISLAQFSPRKKDSEEVKNLWAAKQEEWHQRYEHMKDEAQATERFIGEVASAVKRIKDDLKEGGAGDVKAEDIVVFTRRKASEIEVELKRLDEDFNNKDSAFGKALNSSDFKQVVETYPEVCKALSAAGYLDALRWVGQVDPKTVEERKAAAAKKAKEKEEKQDERKAGKKAETIARATQSPLLSFFKGSKR